MNPESQPARPRTVAGTFFLLQVFGIALLLMGSVPLTAQEQQADGAEEPETAEPVDKRDLIQPPDGKWLVDEKGMEYYEYEYPKGREGVEWRWIGENRIRVRYGIPFDVIRHDDETFWVKMYKPLPRRTKPMTREEMDAAAGRPPRLTPEQVRETVCPATPLPTAQLRFAPYDRGLPRNGQWRNGFDLADMNSDGHLDIVHGAMRKGRRRPTVFLGNGKGTWEEWRARWPRVQLDYGDVAVADYNGDGHLDIALGMHIVGAMVLLGDGGGNFSPAPEGLDQPDRANPDSQLGKRAAWSGRTANAVDINADGLMDFVVLGEGLQGLSPSNMIEGDPITAAGITAYVNQGADEQGLTRWKAERLTPFGGGDSMHVVDIDDDGDVDILQSMNVLRARDLIVLQTEPGKFSPTELPSLPPLLGAAYAITSADLDNDGVEEIVTGFNTPENRANFPLNSIAVHDRADDVWGTTVLDCWETFGLASALTTGDLNGDGHLDVAASTKDSQLLFYLGDGEGGFAKIEHTLVEQQQNCAGYGLTLADLNGDGRDEVLVGFAGEDSIVSGVGVIRGCERQGSFRAWSPLAPEDGNN